MKPHFSAQFISSYNVAPEVIQKAFNKQLRFLLQNLRHPSLHAKKYNETAGIWQARVNRSWRFYFTIEGEVYTFLDIMPHPK